MSDPNNPYGGGNDNPYGQQPDPNNPYGQTPSYGQSEPYGQQPPAYGQGDAYGAQAPYGGGYGSSQEKHPQAVTALVLGILGLICCGVLAPIAWIMGGKAVKEIDASPGRYQGRELANVGKILGIIGTVLLVLSAVFVVLALAGGILGAVDTSSTTTYNGSNF